jgi:hypothetical protein
MQYKSSPRITKSGVLNKQDVGSMKRDIKQRLKQGMAEAHDAAAKEIHGNLFHDSIPPGAEKHHVSAVLKAHGLQDTDAKDVINRVRKMGYAGPRLDKQETDEGRMIKGPGGVPLDRQGRPVPPKVKPLMMRKWLVLHDGSHGEGGKDIIEAPNAETAWEVANEYDLNIISINPYRGPAQPTLVDESVTEGMWDQHQSIPELERAIENLIMGYKGGLNLTDKGRAQLLLSINKGKRILAKKKQQQDMAEGSELKQAKRKYNQAAKDANLDQVGAGKKIDTMKKSLRQKDLAKQGMAEGWRDVYNLNKQVIGKNPNLIKPGTVLKMPGNSQYQVKPGDTLSSIAKTLGAKPKTTAEPKYYTLPPDAVKPTPVKPSAAQSDSPYVFNPTTGAAGVKPDRIADVFRDTELPPSLTRDEIQQQMMRPDFGGPNAPGFKHTVQGAEGEEYNFDSGEEAKDFVKKIEQLRLQDRERGGLGAATSESTGTVVPSDGFDVVSNYADMRTTDTGNKHNLTYTSTTVQKNPTTGQQKSLSSWDHTDPATGKRYVGSTYTDPQGNAQTQKNYQESKKTKVDEVSLGDYRKKAALSKATSQIDQFFGRDDPAKVARADQTIAKRERGMARADARVKPYTAPPVDQDKQRRDLADKYPDIDELVRQAELNRDPNYEYADGPAYYAGRDAEHKYHRLKQIQRMIRGAELDEMDFGGVSQNTDSATGDVTTSFNQGPISVSQTKTPGGYTKQTDQQFNLGTATMGVKTAGPNIGAGQLAGTTTATATNNQTGQAKQQVRGVGFGGATGPNVGKNYVGATNDELAKHAADSFMGANETIDRMKHLAGIKPAR